MTGRRIDIEPHLFQPGDYGQWQGGWYGVPPATDLLACMTGHNVIEHEDGTLTVSPSILVSQDARYWHGYLERGIWRECK